MKTKFFCAHGHFYQPPREDPWLNHIEKEDSALPFENWNQKIFHECYLPNAFSQALTPGGRISKFINNYAHINFDFGPTLLDWLEKNHSNVYMAILNADAQSVKNFGQGNAIAQIYNHTIMPLASLKDKKTQIKWGLEYFNFKFKRESLGMWLSETASDTDTLEALCQQNIKYTVLSSAQAARFRPIGENKWEVANKISFDDTRAYRWFSKQQKGKFIDIFFYNKEISDSIINKLNDTQHFHEILQTEFSKDQTHQILSIASDGENYGHHQKNADIGLSKLIEKINREKKFRITNFAAFLQDNSPKFEVETVSPSSWSCPHGVDRWKDNCGCRINPQFKSQLWRKHLREALDKLSLKIDALYEEKGKEYFTKPWLTRDKYILCSKTEHATEIKKFLTLNSKKTLTAKEARAALRLLDMQKDKMFMFTSCAWFFDDITDIQSMNAIKRALKAIETAQTFGGDFYDEFENDISKAESNIKGVNLRQIIKNIYLFKNDIYNQTANFAFSLFMDTVFPFEEQSRFHNKIIKKEILNIAGKDVNLYFINTENTETFEQIEFLAIAKESENKALKCALLECKNMEKFNKFAADAKNDFKKFETALKEKNVKIYDFSNLHKSNKTIFKTLIQYPEKEDIHSVMYHWLHIVKNFMPSEILSNDILDTLWSFRKFSFKPGNIPFRDEIIKAFISNFEIILMKENPDISKTKEWLNYLKKDPYRGYILEIKIILFNWLNFKEGPPFMKIEDKTFLKTITELTNNLEIKLKPELIHPVKGGRVKI
ncbi:MAG: DUF3536 domain-containing protein [Elusimicrobiales bacterium]|nr:DUF3536 domain-containing protein [Elusimicrobiales bacterium]